MFTITNTRIVGLIAVVCAVIATPQALASPSIHSRIAPPGDEPSGAWLCSRQQRPMQSKGMT